MFPQEQVQLCSVHLVLNSLSYISHKDRKQIAADLKAVYLAATLEEIRRVIYTTTTIEVEHDLADR